MERYLRFEYFFIIMVLVWEPFQVFVLKVDGAGYTKTILSIVLLAILMRKKSFYKIALKKPLIIWLIWVFYAFINSLIIGNGSDLPVLAFFTNIFVPLLLMIVITIEFKRDYKKLLNILITGLYLSTILTLVFISETAEGRIGGELNSNTIGTTATVLCMFIYLKYYKKNINILWFLILVSIPAITIISTGSRTAFGGLALLLGLHFFLKRSKSIITTVFKLVFVAMLLFFPINYLLENTGIGKRITSTSEQSEDYIYETGIPILDKFGDRGIFYYIGWQIFIDNPIAGIGIDNYKDYNEFEVVQHSEYMIQLSELGFIGFTLFFLFYFSIFKDLSKIKSISINKRESVLYMGYVVIILLMITATRMYKVAYLFAVIGVVIGFTQDKVIGRSIKHIN